MVKVGNPNMNLHFVEAVVADSLSAYYPEGLRPPSGRSRYFSNGNLAC
jgi:hypothetical protein